MSWRPLQFLIAMCAGSLQRRQQTLVAYLIEENLVLRKKLGPKRLRFTDAERRRLALKAKSLGRKTLRRYATLAAQVRQMLEDSGVEDRKNKQVYQTTRFTPLGLLPNPSS